MNLFCPTCDAAFTGATACPKCNGRLVTPSEAFALPFGSIPAPPDVIRPTAVTRMLVGVVAGLGAYYAGRDLAAAFAVPSGEPAADWWAIPVGAGVDVGLRVVAAVVGGLFAGAGRPGGATTGLAAGLVMAGVLAASVGNPDPAVRGLEAVALAAVVVVAAAAGMVGAWRWKPAAEPPRVNTPSTRGSSLVRFAEEQNKVREESSPPTRWVRIVLAAALATAGVAYADDLREQLRVLTGGAGRLGNPGSAGLLDLGLATGVVFLAGASAGAGSAAGGRHGLLVGLLATFGVLIYAPRRGEAGLQPLSALLEGLDMPTDLGASDSLLAVAGFVVGTCLLAGWLGGQLLPPLAPPGDRSRAFPLS